jgi:hypothetical protein
LFSAAVTGSLGASSSDQGAALPNVVFRWDAGDWTLSGSDVTSIRNKTFSPGANMQNYGTRSVPRTSLSNGMPAWNTRLDVSGVTYSWTSAYTLPETLFNKGAVITVHAQTPTPNPDPTCILSWGAPSGLSLNYLYGDDSGNIKLKLGGSDIISTASGVLTGSKIILVSWDMSLASGSRKANIWTLAGGLLASTSTSTGSIGTTGSMQAGAVSGLSVSPGVYSTVQICNEYVDEVMARSILFRFAKSWKL